jgi:hypothetical protein
MWCPSTAVELIEQLTTVQCVDQIVIINNKTDCTPTTPVLLHDKIMMLNQAKNIYVNPAWNLGVEHATNELVCLLNDDILFDLRVFEYLTDKITDSDGIYGLNMTDQSDRLHVQATDTRCWGFGCLMCFHKNTYCTIPTQLKILYGDDFLFNASQRKHKQNFLINGVKNNQAVHATYNSSDNLCDPYFSTISKAETEYYRSIRWE